MFERYFGLKENPFNLTPDPQYLFLSDVHKEALSHLRYGIEQKKGFVLVTGEVGTGKTTLCRALLGMLGSNTKTALILNPSLSDLELLQSINQEFGLQAELSSKKALLDELNAFLLEVKFTGGNAVLIIDECQNMDAHVLEQVRMLSNLETEKEKLLQIIMVGQPELAGMLASSSLKQINDRIVLRYAIGPLSRDETRDYIAHRLMVSGSHGDIRFTRSALRRIMGFSSGLPRRINAVCERALLIAYLKGTRKIDAPIIQTAVRELRGEYASPAFWRAILMPAGVLAVAMIAVAFLWPMLPTGIIPSRVTPVAETISPAAILTQTATTTGGVSPAAQGENVPIRRDWIVPGYQTALELLYQIPEGLRGPDDLNLHPTPESLRHMDRPFIASVAGGYGVVSVCEGDYVRVVGPSRGVFEIPMDVFVQLYKWNIMVSYTRSLETRILRLADEGDEVRLIQVVLAKKGYLTIEPDGVYGVETAAGVERLQEDYGLRRDGIVGPETLALMGMLGRERP